MFISLHVMKSRKKISKSVIERVLILNPTRQIYLLSLIVGLLSALAAVLLKNTIHFTAQFVSANLRPGAGYMFYFFAPAAGIIITFFFVKLVVKENISHGISQILYAISKKKSYLKSKNIWAALVGSSITIGFGGSVGAEDPIVLTGSSIGSSLGRLFKMNYRQITLLTGCGAAGAIAGIFKAPVAGIVFTLEILMLDLTLSSIVPLLISSVTAATVTWLLMGDTVLLNFPVKEPFIVGNVPWYIVLGIFTGLVSVWFTKMTLITEKFYKKINNQYTRLITGAAVTGLLVLAFPPFFGEGYTTINNMLNGNISSFQSIFSGIFHDSWPYLVFISGAMILLKVFATSSTNCTGGIGGIFAPTLFTGALTGYFVTLILERLFNISLPDSRFVLVGMAGVMSGVIHAPLTAIFLIAEVTGGYNLLIPLIITSTVSFITARGFVKYSIYHIQLANRGELITHDKDKAVLVVMDWKKDIETDLMTVRPDAHLRDLVGIITKSKRNIFPVVDEYGVLEGIVTLDDVREIMFNSDLYDKIYIREVMTVPSMYIDKSENMAAVMDAFSRTGAWNLPVLDKGIYVGIISKSRIFSTYRDLLVQQFSEE